MRLSLLLLVCLAFAAQQAFAFRVHPKALLQQDPPAEDAAADTEAVPDKKDLPDTPANGQAESAVAGLDKAINALPTSKNVLTPVGEELTKALNGMKTLQVTVDAQKEWLGKVHDIIAEYQFKYTSARKDMEANINRIQKLRDLTATLKSANAHEQVQNAINAATSELSTLMDGEGEDAKKYGTLRESISKLTGELDSLRAKGVDQALKTVQKQMADNELSDVPPESADALNASPASGGDSAGGEEGGDEEKKE